MNKGTCYYDIKGRKSQQPYISKLPTLFYLTTSMEHGSWETNAYLDITDFLRIMCNSNIHCRVHKTPPLTCRLCPIPYDYTLKSVCWSPAFLFSSYIYIQATKTGGFFKAFQSKPIKHISFLPCPINDKDIQLYYNFLTHSSQLL